MSDDNEATQVMKYLAEIMQQPRLEGIPQTLVGPMSQMGYFPKYAQDIPGSLDNVADALETEQSMAYGYNVKGKPRVQEFHEYGKDKTVSHAVGDYSSIFLNFLNGISAGKAKVITNADNKIKELNNKYQINHKEIFRQIKEAEREQRAEKLTAIFELSKVYAGMTDPIAMQMYLDTVLKPALT